MQDILLQPLRASITWLRGMRKVVSFQRSLLPIMILVRGSGQNQDSWIYLECGGDGETDHYEIREEICPEREVL